MLSETEDFKEPIPKGSPSPSKRWPSHVRTTEDFSTNRSVFTQFPSAS